MKDIDGNEWIARSAWVSDDMRTVHVGARAVNKEGDTVKERLIDISIEFIVDFLGTDEYIDTVSDKKET